MLSSAMSTGKLNRFINVRNWDVDRDNTGDLRRAYSELSLGEWLRGVGRVDRQSEVTTYSDEL
jgi:hypothetical protein